MRGAALLLADVVHGRELVGSNPSHCSFAGYQEVVFDVGDLSGSTGIGVNLVLDGVSTHLDVGGQHLGVIEAHAGQIQVKEAVLANIAILCNVNGAASDEFRGQHGGAAVNAKLFMDGVGSVCVVIPGPGIGGLGNAGFSEHVGIVSNAVRVQAVGDTQLMALSILGGLQVGIADAGTSTTPEAM